MELTRTCVVDSQSCLNLTDKFSPFILVIHKDQNLIDTIRQCLERLNIQGASLSGLGALENPQIAYFDRNIKAYQEQRFLGEFELISLSGNMAINEDKQSVVHIHVSLGDKEYKVIGGHLVDAIVAITAEITVIPLPQPILRKMNLDFSLKLISP